MSSKNNDVLSPAVPYSLLTVTKRLVGHSWSSHPVLGLCGKVLVVGGYRGGFCEKLPEASPMSDGANTSRLQDRPIAGQGQAHQQQCNTSVVT